MILPKSRFNMKKTVRSKVNGHRWKWAVTFHMTDQMIKKGNSVSNWAVFPIKNCTHKN